MEKAVVDLSKQVEELTKKVDLDRAVEAKVNKAMYKGVVQQWQTLVVVVGFISLHLVFTMSQNNRAFANLDKKITNLDKKVANLDKKIDRLEKTGNTAEITSKRNPNNETESPSRSPAGPH